MPKIDPNHPQKCGRRKIKLLKYAGKKVIGYKKAATWDGGVIHHYIVTLEIAANTRAQSVHGHKCRAASAKVIAVEKLSFSDTNEPILKMSRVSPKSEHGYYTNKSPYKALYTTYKVGKIVKPDRYDTNLRECSNGIHFFLEKKQAIEYRLYLLPSSL